MTIEVNNIVSGIFLFILIGFGNYIYNIIPNNLEKIIVKNLWLQHLIILFLINFSVNLVDNTNQSPLDNFYNSLVVYLFYMLFSKSHNYVSIIILLILAAMYILVSQREYLRENNLSSNHIEKTIDILSYLSIGLLVISNFYIIYIQMLNNPNFNIFKFYFKNNYKIT